MVPLFAVGNARTRVERRVVLARQRAAMKED